MKLYCHNSYNPILIFRFSKISWLEHRHGSGGS